MKEVPPRLENETIEAYVERIQAGELLRGNSKAIRPGHLYQLANVEEKGNFQILQFIEKEPRWPGAAEYVTINDGTTSEAVLEMLIDRSKAMYEAIPNPETADAIKYMQAALTQFEIRTIRRMAQGIKGKNEA